MRKNFTLVYLLLLAVQMMLTNYFHVTTYITLTILPVMVFCIPVKNSPSAAMIIAFATGLVVDLFADGVPGLNAAALVPIAFVRNPLIRLIFGDEAFERNEKFVPAKFGMAKISVAILLIQSIFLLIYIILDGAGTRPFAFNIVRFGASLITGYLLSLFVIGILSPDDRL